MNMPVCSGFPSTVLCRSRGRRRGVRDFIGEVTFARADLHVRQSGNVHGDFAVLLGPGLRSVVVRLVAQDVLRGDLAADTADGLDDAVRDLRRVAVGTGGYAGAISDGVDDAVTELRR